MTPYRPNDRFFLARPLATVIAVHVLALAGLILYPVTWNYFLAALAIAFAQGFSISLVYHRGLTHRAFAFRIHWVEKVFVTLTTLALQAGPIWWCSIHRIHHQCSDTPRDPHNSRRGFWYSHLWWMGYLDQRWQIPSRVEGYKDAIKDISADPFYQWLDRYYYLPPLLFYLILYLAGGWGLLFWGGAVATVFQWHSTFATNSVTHSFGYRNLNTPDTSTNFWAVGWLLGEGWHNNHHAFPSSARLGSHKWWEVDIIYLFILLLKKIGLVNMIRKIDYDNGACRTSTPASLSRRSESSPMG